MRKYEEEAADVRRFLSWKEIEQSVKKLSGCRCVVCGIPRRTQEKEDHRMRLIDKGKLMLALNDKWLATAMMDNVSEEVKAERNAMCWGLNIATDIVQRFPEVETVKDEKKDADHKNNASTVGWISVKDRMPEQAGYRCLVAAKFIDGTYCLFTAFTGYGEPGWWTYENIYMEEAPNNKVHHDFKVTHWMPLPEPPKEEQ